MQLVKFQLICYSTVTVTVTYLKAERQCRIRADQFKLTFATLIHPSMTTGELGSWSPLARCGSPPVVHTAYTGVESLALRSPDDKSL